jgi:hypothetical protein
LIADRVLRRTGEIFHRFVDAVIFDVVARRFGAEDEVIADVLFDEAVSIMAADHGVGQVLVLDLGLQLASIVLGDLDGSIGVEQTFAEHVQCRTATEDEVVAELHLLEEQPVLATRMLSLLCAEEGCEARQPFLAAAHQISGRERVGEFWQAIWR